MPIHIQPVLRNRELALEAAGLIVKLNSDVYNNTVSAENAGKSPIAIPTRTFNFNGTSFPAKE